MVERARPRLILMLELRNGSGDPHTVPLTRELLVHYTTFFQVPDADEVSLFDPAHRSTPSPDR
jgi:hypothetical protein